MANFCRACTSEFFGAWAADQNELATGQTTQALCEGCGWGLFDESGARIPRGAGRA